MAARDRYSVDLNCPDCGETGRADCSEDDYPFMRSLDFSVDHIQGGFAVTKLGETPMATDISCKKCGLKVW